MNEDKFYLFYYDIEKITPQMLSNIFHTLDENFDQPVVFLPLGIQYDNKYSKNELILKLKKMIKELEEYTNE